MQSEEKRRRVVAAAMQWTANTTIAPNVYEGYLLQLYAEGKLSIEECLELTVIFEAQQLPAAI